jgi:hypothetical protein
LHLLLVWKDLCPISGSFIEMACGRTWKGKPISLRVKTVTAAQSTWEEKEGRKGSLRWEMILSEESC